MTETQLELVKVKPIVVPKPLTDRQAEALEHVQAAGANGINASDLGRLMGAPPLHTRSTGSGLLKALKKKGHVRETTGKIYIALHTTTGDDFGKIPF